MLKMSNVLSSANVYKIFILEVLNKNSARFWLRPKEFSMLMKDYFAFLQIGFFYKLA